MTAAEQLHVSEVSRSYWRVTFDNGPLNLLDPDTIDQLAGLIGRIENDPDLTVVVFRSDKPGYFMAHWDFLADKARVAGMRPGPTGLHPYLDNFVRLSRLPVATISLVQLGSHVRYLRASMLETIGQEYMRTARAKGLAERVVVLRHALKNAAIPLVTVVALDVPELFVGALVTEQIFGWPGMGRLFLDAAFRSDYPVLQGILAVSSTLIVLANLLADVAYGYLDPRIRFS